MVLSVAACGSAMPSGCRKAVRRGGGREPAIVSCTASHVRKRRSAGVITHLTSVLRFYYGGYKPDLTCIRRLVVLCVQKTRKTSEGVKTLSAAPSGTLSTNNEAAQLFMASPATFVPLRGMLHKKHRHTRPMMNWSAHRPWPLFPSTQNHCCFTAGPHQIVYLNHFAGRSSLVFAHHRSQIF